MTQYVKKRIPVDAMQYRVPEGDSMVFSEEFEILREFANYLVRFEFQPKSDTYEYFVFDYLHNTWVQFKEGDWIIKGIRGEFYPCEESVFAETYEVYDGDES